MINIFIKILGRQKIFDAMFSKNEKTAIINALWRRSEDDRNASLTNQTIKDICKRVAKEMMT